MKSKFLVATYFSFSLFFFALVILFLFPPLITLASASHLNLSSCYPEDLQQRQQCPYEQNQGQTEVNIKWDLSTQFPTSKAFCKVEVTTSPDHWQDFALAKTDDGYVSSSLTGIKLKAKDNLIIKNPPSSAVYRTVCCEANEAQTGCKPTKAKSSSYIYSPDRAIVGSVPCEVPFEEIISGLFVYKNTVITENNFKDWSIVDSIDRNGYGEVASSGRGSGDQGDMKSFIDMNQCYVLSVSRPENTDYVRTFDYLKKNSDNHDAAPIAIAVFDSETGGLIGYHMMIELSFKPKDRNDSNPASFVLEVLDPNEATIRKLDVKKRQFQVSPGMFVDAWVIEDYCRSPDPSEENVCSKSIILNTAVAAPDMVSLSTLKSNAVRRNTADWLRSGNNRPYIPNFSGKYPESANGVCAGWSDFVLAVAYHGDFVGEDYHPNDGKIVGRDCDANHYPISKSSKSVKSVWLDSSNWLGNVLSIWNKLWPMK